MNASNNANKKIAIIGAGIFGCTTAIRLAKAGFRVDLYEKHSGICSAASGINQYRLHAGYHYPRSSNTVESCKKATPLFEEEYKEAIIGDLDHFYAIAKHKSFVTGDEYVRFLDRHNLSYEILQPNHINHDAVSLVVKAEEKLFDPEKIKSTIYERLKEVGVNLYLNRELQVDDLDEHDKVVVATYASLNSCFGEKYELQREYQFEVCEKIVVSIPDELKGISTVVMDGPFMSFDPLGKTGLAVMGHVEHAIFKRSFGYMPEIPGDIAPMLNRGVISNPIRTNADKFIEEGAHFMPALRAAKHQGSMFTIRTVLPRVEDSDARPTIVNALDDRIITIYSGKIGNSVEAAENVIRLIET